MADFSESAAFVWYSSNSYLNRVGSLMVYSIDDGAATGWYCTLKHHEDKWALDKAKGISREEIISYMGGES